MSGIGFVSFGYVVGENFDFESWLVMSMFFCEFEMVFDELVEMRVGLSWFLDWTL